MIGRILVLIAALSLSASMVAPPAEGQELKKVRMGYPAFSLTFLTFFVAQDRAFIKSMDWMLT